MVFLSKYFWIAFILVIIANGVVWWVRGAPHRERDHSLAEGYRALIRGFLIWGNVPWIVMGIGIVFGGVPSLFSYFDPGSGNPFVLVFLGSAFLVWGAGTYWIFVRGGAEKLVRHPGLLQYKGLSARAIRAYWLACVASGLIAVALMFSGKLPIPEFTTDEAPPNGSPQVERSPADR